MIRRPYSCDRDLEQTTPLSVLQGWEVVMKRSSIRRAKRWIIQELTRLGQRNEAILDQTHSIESKPDASHA